MNPARAGSIGHPLLFCALAGLMTIAGPAGAMPRMCKALLDEFATAPAPAPFDPTRGAERPAWMIELGPHASPKSVVEQIREQDPLKTSFRRKDWARDRFHQLWNAHRPGLPYPVIAWGREDAEAAVVGSSPTAIARVKQAWLTLFTPEEIDRPAVITPAPLADWHGVRDLITRALDLESPVTSALMPRALLNLLERIEFALSPEDFARAVRLVRQLPASDLYDQPRVAVDILAEAMRVLPPVGSKANRSPVVTVAALEARYLELRGLVERYRPKGLVAPSPSLTESRRTDEYARLAEAHRFSDYTLEPRPVGRDFAPAEVFIAAGDQMRWWVERRIDLPTVARVLRRGRAKAAPSVDRFVMVDPIDQRSYAVEVSAADGGPIRVTDVRRQQPGDPRR